MCRAASRGIAYCVESTKAGGSKPCMDSGTCISCALDDIGVGVQYKLCEGRYRKACSCSNIV